MSRLKSPFFWFILAVLTTAGLTSIGPEERSLGENVRIIYLHDAWLLTAEAALGFAALVGLLAILTRRDALHRWSAALGRTGIFFWVTYLPLASGRSRPTGVSCSRPNPASRRPLHWPRPA